MAQTVSITTPEQVTLEFELAGLVTRFAAWLIDGLFIALSLIGLVFVLVGLGVAFFDESSAGRELGSWGIAVLILLYFCLTWGYGTVWEGMTRGRTPGKMAMGIRVVRGDGLPIGWWEAAIRNLARAADMLPPPAYGLGALCIFLDGQARRLGDIAAGTLVVRDRFEFGFDSRVGASWVARAEEGRYSRGLVLPGGVISSDRLMLIEQLLERLSELPVLRQEQLTWQVVEPMLVLLGEQARGLEQAGDRHSQCLTLLRDLLKQAELSAASGRVNPARSSEPGSAGGATGLDLQPGTGPLF